MKTKGICRFCNREFSSVGMAKHLQSCTERKKEKEEKGEVFLIRASSSNDWASYWVYFEASYLHKLYDVDSFLRKLWLECCGHLSAFNINSNEYFYHTLENGQFDMDIYLKDILYPGIEFNYEYDFGSTTELKLRCISVRPGKIERINILAKNEPPEFFCDECGKPAKYVCVSCLWESKGFLCDSCVNTHECGYERFLPIVNSPRMGVCGYTGGIEDNI